MSAQSVTADFERRPEPVRRQQLIPNGVMGMIAFIFTELMFFAGLISAHTIVRSQVAGQMWPPFGQPRLPVEETAVNTAALMASGIVLVLTWFAFRRDPRLARIPLLISLGLGAFFVLFQGAEWLALLSEGLTMTSSTYGAFFYLIVGGPRHPCPRCAHRPGLDLRAPRSRHAHEAAARHRVRVLVLRRSRLACAVLESLPMRHLGFVRGRSLVVGVLALALLAILPDVASACPVCFDARDENRQAFLATTVFLSLFPLGMVATVGLWVRKRSRDLDEQDAPERRDELE